MPARPRWASTSLGGWGLVAGLAASHPCRLAVARSDLQPMQQPHAGMRHSVLIQRSAHTGRVTPAAHTRAAPSAHLLYDILSCCEGEWRVAYGACHVPRVPRSQLRLRLRPPAQRVVQRLHWRLVGPRGRGLGGGAGTSLNGRGTCAHSRGETVAKWWDQGGERPWQLAGCYHSRAGALQGNCPGLGPACRPVGGSWPHGRRPAVRPTAGQWWDLGKKRQVRPPAQIVDRCPLWGAGGPGGLGCMAVGAGPKRHEGDLAPREDNCKSAQPVPPCSAGVGDTRCLFSRRSATGVGCWGCYRCCAMRLWWQQVLLSSSTAHGMLPWGRAAAAGVSAGSRAHYSAPSTVPRSYLNLARHTLIPAQEFCLVVHDPGRGGRLTAHL